MRVAGVVCEFNPFHAGHAYLLARMRETVGDGGIVLCAMSGRFVQRGTPAMADPYLRAHTALVGGADLVVELPFPWSAGSAEAFAAAGVHLLVGMGADTVAFGSECGYESLLRRAAEAVMAPDFGERYAALCRDGVGTAAAYATALRAGLGNDIPADFPSSNDFLGIAYLCALEKIRQMTGNAPAVTVVRREGAGYRDDILATTGYPSATALRRLIIEAADDPITLAAMLEGTMPAESLAILLAAIERGEAPVIGDRLLPFFHAYYRLQAGEAVESYAECGGGLAGQMVRCAAESATPEAFFEALRSRRYTDARLRRALLYGALGVTREDLRAMPTYALLLGATERGRAYLKARQKAQEDGGGIRVVTKPADAPEGRQRTLMSCADALYTLCSPISGPSGALMKKSPIIL